jgi:uncharacterized protein (TIGR00299 family) protein
MNESKVLYIECNAGISGDMTLGALIDLGVDVTLIREGLAKLPLQGHYELIPSTIQRSGITGTDLDVQVSILNSSNADNHEHGNGHNHNHNHDHEHDEKSSFRYIKKMIEDSSLKSNVKKISIDIFTAIGKAEGNVHQKSLDEVVFHEVGALDSIIDIVGTAIAVDALGIDKVYCSQVSDGTGFIDCRHGIIPVPVPAVMEMMQGGQIPAIINEDVKTEMVTPTGFGILLGLHAEFKSKLEIKINKVGYGFGDRDTGLFSAVRISLGYVNN